VNGLITNTLTTTNSFTNVIDSVSNQYFRIRRLDATTVDFAIDSLRITYPIPRITISDLTNTPVRVTDLDSVNVSVNVSMIGNPDTFAMTNYWREWPSTNWSLIAMPSNAPTLYTTTSAIPGKIVGAQIEYFARATFTLDGITYTNSSVTNAYVVLPRSSYTNLSVTGQVAAATGQLTPPLRCGLNYNWQGVIQVTNSNPTFKFKGTSNGVNTIWGETNQTATTVPIFGQAEVTSSDITLYTTNIGHYLFSFNETNLDYSVRSCVYESFNNWTNTTYSTNGIYTNNQWILRTGNTSNDAYRIFEGTGRSAIVATNGWVRSPYLTNGVGQVSFWYRNGEASATPAASFLVELSSDNTNWTTLGGWSLTNIVTTNYLFFSTAANDLASKYIRVRSTNSTSRLCLDEIAITPPGATIISSNLVTTPLTPTVLDSISFSIDLTTYNGASITSVTNWYRVSSTGQWEAIAMTNTTGTLYVTRTPIEGVPAGTSNLQYAVACTYSGFQASSPVFFPLGGTGTPASVSISIPANNRQENFDSNWPGAPWAYRTYLNATNPISGWSVQSNSIASSQPSYVTTLSNACFFGRATSGQAWLKSPLLTNGIGSVFFTAKNSSATPVILVLESSYDGTSWFTNVNGLVTNVSTTTNSFTNIINSASDQYLRIRRVDATTVDFAMDTVSITYPPTDVLVTNVFINPGYPVAGQTFTASCDVVSLNPIFPAYNIAPRLNYWTSSATNSTAMTRSWTAGVTSHFTSVHSIANVTRDTPLYYLARANFDGYYGSTAENMSPRLSITNSITVRASASSYGTVSLTANGTTNSARLLSDSLWQTVISATNSMLTFSLLGDSYSAGSGYATSSIAWGNSNSWQTSIPLADTVTADTTTVSVAVSSNSQYVVRYDESTGLYIVNRCVFQDFDKPGEGDGTIYKQTTLSANAGGASQDFDIWSTNTTQVRSENFDGTPWAPDYTSGYFSGVGGGTGFIIQSGRVVLVSGSDYVLQTFSNVNPFVMSDSFIAQGSHWGTTPLRGIGRVSYSYAASRTNTPSTIGVYIWDTNNYPEPAIGETSYTAFKVYDSWLNGPVSITTNVTNTTYSTVTVDVNTSRVQDVFFAHTAGTQSLKFASVSVGEWYSEALQTNSDGWVASEYWIEESRIGYGNACRLDTTRATNRTNQFLRSPRIDSGIKFIEFYYAGVPSLSQNPPSNIIVNFTVELSSNPTVWTNTLDTISTNFVGNFGSSNYFRYFRTLQTSQGGLYVRIKNSTVKPGALLLDRIDIPGYATTNDWYINNASIDYKDQKYPPYPRQYYRGVVYLNNTRTNSSAMASGEDYPATNTYPQIRTPILPDGIGEISFRYRNWATSGTVNPGKLVIQSAPYLTSATNESDWTTTITNITNIRNTNDYSYFTVSVYDTTNQYLRIYADDTYTNPAGRVCLDEVLVTAPIATSLSMSNLVVTPGIPVYTNTVNVSVDVYNLFLNPTISGLTAYYGTASAFSNLAAAGTTSRAMTCIATNSGPKPSYTFRTTTPIPAQSVDTFVKYFVVASYTGHMSQATSPKTQDTFGSDPAWLYPLDVTYGTNFAYYVVLSSPTGTVWINELNYGDYTDDYVFTNEFIELAGSPGSSINSWKLEIYDQNFDTSSCYQVYYLTNNATLSNTVSGLGFWVIGDTGVANRSQILTEVLSGGYTDENLPYSGYIILSRSSGIYEDRLRFGFGSSETNGFTYAGDDPFTGVDSLGLNGTGTVKSAFSWAAAPLSSTPGWINIGQQAIAGGETNEPPTVTIVSFWLNTNVWIICTTTNNWYPAPWYTTNLLSSNSWTNVSPYSRSLTSSNCTINFTKPAGTTPYFYKVVATNSP
jgi:hypothetical protein